MDTTPPDIEELKDAQARIEDVNDLLIRADSMLDDMRGMGPRSVLAPAATYYKDLLDLMARIEDLRLRVYHMKEGFVFHVLPPLFRDASVDTVKTLNGYTVTMADDLSVSIPADRKTEAYDWLDANGYSDIIQSTVNASTLKATMKGIMKDGVVIPEDVFKLNILHKYRVTRSSSKNT